MPVVTWMANSWIAFLFSLGVILGWDGLDLLKTKPPFSKPGFFGFVWLWTNHNKMGILLGFEIVLNVHCPFSHQNSPKIVLWGPLSQQIRLLGLKDQKLYFSLVDCFSVNSMHLKLKGQIVYLMPTFKRQIISRILFQWHFWKCPFKQSYA